MDNLRTTTLAAALFLSLGILFASCEKTTSPINDHDSAALKTDTTEQNFEASLIFMREEEKLAHDVYFNLFETYPIPVFRNISKSELHHTNAIKGLLDFYGLEDPYQEGIGLFSNPELSTLYTELMALGAQDLESALKVGATIEEVDILDLNEAIAQCTEDTVIMVYNRLLNASGNHLRAFVRQLEFRGFEYAPQFLTEELYNGILNGTHHQGGNCDTINVSLTEDEQNGLLFMREEDKLAHDVYVQFYDLWNIPVFINISKSEQQHTTQVLRLLDKYHLEDPVQEGLGVFSNTDLQELYNQFIVQGSISSVDALIVGATIEEVDIIDLWERLDQTENPAITRTYTQLEKASESHLRAFVRILSFQGVEYTPQYISQEEFERIMNP
jgi:hypothetical protein